MLHLFYMLNALISTRIEEEHQTLIIKMASGTRFEILNTRGQSNIYPNMLLLLLN